MQIIFYFVLMLGMCCCSDLTLEQKNVTVGDGVELDCETKKAGTMLWIKLVSGRLPIVFGRSSGFDTFPVRFVTKKEHGAFQLHITKTTIEDTSVYLCIRFVSQDMTFVKGVDLKVKGTRAAPTRDPVPSEHLTTLSYGNRCQPEDTFVCFRSESNTSLNYKQRNHDYLTIRNCVTFQNFTVSDLQRHHCGHHENFGSNSTNNSQAENVCKDSKTDHTVVYLLCGALTLALIVIATLINYIFKLKRILCNNREGAFVQQPILTEDETEEMDEDKVIYCTAIFTPKKDRIREPKITDPAEEIIYSDVRVH
ncbi:uncharacterized protein LOC114471464 isoform X2 [Gouania willdenowi]|uniref:Uncharacterized LOC114471464 n=1 Tax=Gouania willdenowi TaxID=441366 RepID=A0A8C5HHM4_GOUWI|nr:uncharacterized protein LOC114471464 isoform X2 [Gouania willdenowi]